MLNKVQGRMKKIIFALVAIVASLYSSAQQLPVGTELIEDCQFFLVDSGLSAGDYGPDENLTSVICNDGTGDGIITLYFASANLGTGDQISFYDGDNTGAPLIGTYTGNDLAGENIISTGSCMTVVFISNDDDSVGSFGAAGSCSLPCERPIAVINTDAGTENPLLVCPGEEISFDGSASQFFNDTQLASFTWDFGDGTTDQVSWPNVTHVYENPGAYIAQLYLTDDSECNSGNLPDALFFVATVPDIVTTLDDDLVCIGQEVHLEGSATPVTYTALPDANFGGALFIPDDQSECFSSELVFGAFAPGATLQNVDDLLSIYINFEHSFMGDLVISIICPDNTSVILHNQGGGGTFLGEPVDNDSDLEPGVGYDYWWSPTATNGTWADNATGTLPSGTYESFGDLSDLVGCPLNGAWSIEVCDMWGSDNGFIFDWGITFADYLYPDLISFTPSIGQDCDSTFWAGGFITNTAPDCNSLTVVPTEEGTFTYTFAAFDNHGCSYEQSVELEVYPGPIPSVDEDVIFCGDAVEISGGVTNPVSGINYVYSWAPYDALSNSNSQTTNIVNLDETTYIVMSVYPQSDPQCLVKDSLRAIVPLAPEPFPYDTIYLCYGYDIPIIVPSIELTYDYEWNYSQTLGGDLTYFGNSVQTVPIETGFYYVTQIEPICGLEVTNPYYVQMRICDITIPNVFTPNGDSQNNAFEVEGLLNFRNSTVKIYNRWGTLIYENDDYRNNWSPDEQQAEDGVYYYIVGVNKPTGMEFFEGWVSIMR